MKTVVISGANSGIGHSIVKTFSDKGWQVLMIARNEERLKQVKEQNKNTDYIVCDLSSPEQISNLKKTLDTKKMKIHSLINNAGIYQPQPISEDHDSVWENHFQNNLMSAIRLTRLFWTPLKESKGSIVNISSTLGLRPIPSTSAYSALKAAMNNWTLSLALEGAEFGLTANAICPGIVDTPIHSYFNSKSSEEQELYKQLQKAQPLGRTGKPQDIASMAFQLCQVESEWITGSIINIDGGILLNS